jgi:hypothetical protein
VCPIFSMFLDCPFFTVEEITDEEITDEETQMKSHG